MRARPGGCFEHPGAEPLTAHFHQAKAGNPANLNARTIILERVLHRLFDFADVARIFHVDEVDHDEPCHIAKAQLAGDFARGFEVGVQRGRFDPMFLRGTAGVDVDRHQRLGRVDDQIAAAFQLHHRIIHRAQLIFGAVTLEQGNGIGIGLHPARMAGHQHFHESLGGFVPVLAFNDDFLDFLVVDIADRPFDQVAVRMNQRRRNRGEGVFADLVPHAGEVIEVAFDFRLGAAHAGRAHDQTHRARQFEIGHHVLQTLAIAG